MSDTQAVMKKQYTPEQAWEVGLPSIESIDLLKGLARNLVGTPFLPRSLCRDGLNPEASLLAVMLTGREMKMAPMESIRSFYVGPGGELGMKYTGMLAVMLRNGYKVSWDLDTASECNATFARPDGQSYVSKFTIEQARRAGLVKPDSAWIKFPENMLRARCTANAWRLLAGDLAGGAALYAKEELDDLYAGGGDIVDVVEPNFKVGRTTEAPPTKAEPTVVATVKSEPVIEPDLAEQFAARMDVIREKIHEGDKRLAPASINAKINGFFKEYLAMKVLPHDPAILSKPLEALEAIARDTGKWAGFMRDPSGAAKNDRVGLEAMFNEWGWSPATQAAAKQVMVKRGMPSDQFLAWVSGALKLEAMPDLDVLAFFAVANCTEEAYRVIEISGAYGVSIAEAVALLGQQLPGGTLVEATEEDFSKAFDTLEAGGSPTLDGSAWPKP